MHGARKRRADVSGDPNQYTTPSKRSFKKSAVAQNFSSCWHRRECQRARKICAAPIYRITQFWCSILSAQRATRSSAPFSRSREILQVNFCTAPSFVFQFPPFCQQLRVGGKNCDFCMITFDTSASVRRLNFDEREDVKNFSIYLHVGDQCLVNLIQEIARGSNLVSLHLFIIWRQLIDAWR